VSRIRLLLLCLCFGVVLGLVRGAWESWLQGYPSLGYWRNAFSVLRVETTVGLLSGGVTAVVLLAWRTLWNPLRKKSVDTARGLSLFLVLFSLALSMIAVRAIMRNLGAGWAVALVLVESVIGLWVVIVIWRQGSSPRATESLAAAAIVSLGLALANGALIRAVGRTEFLAAVIILAVSVLVLGLAKPSAEAPERPRSYGLLVGTAIGALVPALLWALSATAATGGLQPKEPRNVIVIGIDTLRADHTSLPGPNLDYRDTTPCMTNEAENGYVFTTAISQSSWTMPSFASILTGKYPHNHGAFLLSGLLRKQEVTLAEVLREAGYGTGAVVSHFFVDAEHGFAQGFDRFDEDLDLGHEVITAHRVTDKAIEMVEDLAGDPFFVFVHYFDPHYQYLDHEDWDYSDDYDGWLRREKANIKNLRMKRHFMEGPDVDYLVDLYQEEIAHTDREIGRLLDFLVEAGLDDNTIVAIVGDHGEEFMERGWIGHTITLHDEVVRVPLVLRVPGRPLSRHRVDEPVETRAIFNTVLDVVGLPVMLEQPARNLVAVAEDPIDEADAGDPPAVFTSTSMTDAPIHSGKRVRLSSVRTRDWKLIADHTRTREFLYDLRADPDETVNVLETRPEVAERLRGRLQEWWKHADLDAPTRDLDEDEIRRLKASGYL
jgi:arylsulfatase A-like enzyme